MKEEKARVSNRFGDQLEILLRKPDQGINFPILILVQGIGMDMHEWKNYHDTIASELVRHGFATIQFNFSYQKRVTEKLDSEIGLAKRAEELNDIIDWVRRNPKIDPKRIGIYAMSFGVSTVLLSDHSHIRSHCLTCGIGFQPQNYIKRYLDRGDIINRQGETRLTRSSGKTMIVQADFWPSLESLRQEDLVRKLKVPVLVIHRDNDPYLRNEDTHRVFEAIASKNKKLKVFKGAGHGFSDVPQKMQEEFLHDVVEWFRKTL